MRLGEMQSMIASHICNIVAWKRVYLLAVSSPDVFELYLHLRYVDFISYIFMFHCVCLRSNSNKQRWMKCNSVTELRCTRTCEFKLPGGYGTDK